MDGRKGKQQGESNKAQNIQEVGACYQLHANRTQKERTKIAETREAGKRCMQSKKAER